MIDTGFIVAGAITGVVVGMTGVGGGALMTPILLLVFGVSPTKAIATDLWFAAITKMVGARIHSGTGQVDWQVAKRLWLGSLPIALLTVNWVSVGGLTQLNWLSEAIGLVVIFTGSGLLIAPWILATGVSQRMSRPVQFKSVQPVLTVVAGAMLGLCVALTSIGAGAIGSVMLLYLYPFRMTPHRLVATDLVHAIPLAMIAGSGYLVSGLVDGVMLANLLLGSIPGIVAGALLARSVSGRWLQVVLGIVLISAGVKTLGLELG